MRPRPLPLGAIANERRGLERRGPSLRPAFSLQGGRARGAISWQTMLADLALILFMVTAAAMGQPAKTPAAKTPAPKPAPLALPYSARGEALAVWRAGAGAPSLGAWLGAQAADQRQQLTISAAYQPGQFARAAARAAALAAQAGAMGRKARLVIEPADSAARAPAPGPGGVDITASLAFDRPDPAAAPQPAAQPAPATPGLARGLQDNVRINPS